MLTTTSSANVSKCVDYHLKVVSYHTAPSKVSQETPPVWARQFPCKDRMSRHSRIVWLVKLVPHLQHTLPASAHCLYCSLQAGEEPDQVKHGQ